MLCVLSRCKTQKKRAWSSTPSFCCLAATSVGASTSARPSDTFGNIKSWRPCKNMGRPLDTQHDDFMDDCGVDDGHRLESTTVVECGHLEDLLHHRLLGVDQLPEILCKSIEMLG